MVHPQLKTKRGVSDLFVKYLFSQCSIYLSLHVYGQSEQVTLLSRLFPSCILLTCRFLEVFAEHS